ncbi:hypothetical protein V1264_008224 [Littorina saxatilis]|uniref:Mucin-like protein n=2 Tax=Littorina saxatilis TaxID=31220 RepID=A0AAN9ASP9_9CAEN
MWLYQIGQVPASPLAVCLNWYYKNLYYYFVREKGFSELPECPCSHRDVWRKMRYFWVRSRTDLTMKTECYRMNRASSNRHYPFGKECCYSLDDTDPLYYGQLINYLPDAGTALAYNPSYYHLRNKYKMEDKLGYDSCCSLDLHPLYCIFYYFLRPIGECRAEIPFRFFWLFGDPHIITLDEREYTFNGWGEYTLITLTSRDSDFVLQGRTRPTVTDSGSPVNATVFTAFGAKENGTRVFVQLDPNTNNSLIIYGGDTDYSRRFQKEGNDFLVDDDKFTLMRENDSLVVSFASEITVAVSIGLRSLVLGVAMPEKFRNMTKGLLGNYNTIKTDDFVLPNGTVLNDDITDRQLHEQFGNAWAVTEATLSVLRYGPREGPSDYTHSDFTTVFYDEISASDRQAAENLCGASDRACIYDFVASGSQDFALQTKKARQEALKDNADIKNVLPSLQVPENVTVTSNVTTNFSVNARDPGDTVTYKLVHDGSGALQINPTTGEITATVNHQQPVNVQVYAIDSSQGQSVVHTIPLIVCSGCSGHGQCDFTHVQQAVGKAYFRYAVCECSTGWTGANCTEDIDACTSSPCHPLQDCIDLTPDQHTASDIGYTCTKCPAGYKSEGQANQCLDVDECADDALNECEVTCNNTAGSYQCSCLDGYRLTSDLHSCADINECAEKSHDCQHICNNTDGGYNCLCQEGFDLDSSGKCVQSASTQSTCVNSGCTQGCKAVTNPDTNNMVPKCFCNSGYALNSMDNKTCIDHDECQDSVCTQKCNNTEGGFICSCYNGFQLNSDQRTCNPCPSLQYGPECAHTCLCNGRGLDCHSVTGCVCKEGWTGSQCQDDVNECEENPDVCGEGQVCTNNNGSYTCACQVGFAPNKDGLCQDTDECSDDIACGQDEICSNIPGSFYCSCMSGYQRMNTTCVDMDECSLGTDNCQQKCVNVGGTYNCECNYGYRLNADRTTCSQVSDPCAEEENLSCDHGCTLDDTDTAVCFCRSGYTLQSDKQTCQDVDECNESSKHCSHTCNNTIGGFTCSCPAGMMLDNDGKTCVSCPSGTYGIECNMTCSCGIGASGCDAVTGCQCKTGWTGDKCQNDVNECDVNSTRQECESKDAKCVNLQGGHRCQCAEGYKMDDSGVCRDIDECMMSPCGQTCENNAGSYRCLCNAGFSLNSTTGDCTDVDECAVSSTHACSQQCDNTAGSYRCSCNVKGYVLNDDGVTCRATMTCSRSDCDDNHGGCYVTDNNVDMCFCNSGYSLESDGTTCTFQRTDWCAQGVCDDACNLTDDGMSFTCSCGDGHILNDDGRTCRACPKDTFGKDCQSNCTCDLAHTESCNSVIGTCMCKPGWQGVTCSDDVNECLTNMCGEHATCSNTVGSHLCSCDVGYIKKSDGMCTKCPANTFGEGCTQTCSCSGDNVQSCDHVTGTCRCKAGWEGSSCDADRDECASETSNDCSSALNMRCQNKEGGYTCLCKDGFTKNIGGACIAVTRLRFMFIIYVNIPTANLVLEPSRSNIMQEVKTQILYMLRFMSDLQMVNIQSLRAGSVIAEADAVVASDTAPSSASGLSRALLDMSGQNATVDGQTGPIGVEVDNMAVTSNTTSCDVYTNYVTCDSNEMCEETDSGPQCRLKDQVIPTESDDGGDEKVLGLIIGLSVGIPLLIVIVCLVAALCYRNAKQKSMTEPERNRNSDVYNFDVQHPLDGRNGKVNNAFAPSS